MRLNNEKEELTEQKVEAPFQFSSFVNLQKENSQSFRTNISCDEEVGFSVLLEATR